MFSNREVKFDAHQLIAIAVLGNHSANIGSL